jgi:hypothetical protein
VEKALYFKMADLMNADVDLIFYDTTSLHFEVDEEDEVALERRSEAYPPLRKRGHSKNGRGDAPQIVVGLAVTRDGLPVRSWVFSGETSDITTVERVKADLRGWRLGRCVFVGDAGMNSEENRRTLTLGNGNWRRPPQTFRRRRSRSTPARWLRRSSCARSSSVPSRAGVARQSGAHRRGSGRGAPSRRYPRSIATSRRRATRSLLAGWLAR